VRRWPESVVSVVQLSVELATDGVGINIERGADRVHSEEIIVVAMQPIESLLADSRALLQTHCRVGGRGRRRGPSSI
jgi:hypothetical protein